MQNARARTRESNAEQMPPDQTIQAANLLQIGDNFVTTRTGLFGTIGAEDAKLTETKANTPT